MAVTYKQADDILNNLFGSTLLPTTRTFYVGLSKTAPNRNGLNISEPSGAGYARVAVENSKTNWNNSSNGVLSNKTSIRFPESTGSWGTITHVFIADASSGGNVMYYDALTTPRNVESLTTLLFAANTLQVTLE